MMILVYLTQQTGVYDYVAIRAGQLSKGRPLAVVLSLAGTTALLSAFLDNLTTILLIVPVTFLLADALDIDPIPLIMIEIIASNIGGTATLIGDPPNIIIAGATDLSFNSFIVNLAPIALVTFVIVTGAALPLVPAAAADRRGEPPLRDGAGRRRVDPRLPTSCGGPGRFSSSRSWPSSPTRRFTSSRQRSRSTGAAVALLVTKVDLEQALSKIEWPTLFFFVGAVRDGRRAGGNRRDRRGRRRRRGSLTGGDRTAELMGTCG